MQKIRYPREYFNIEDTLNCGQVFRYRKNDDGSFCVFSLDKTARLYYEGSEVVIETDHPEYFYNYFDLDTDYSKIVENLSAFSELTDAINYGKGIRILRQNLYETVFSFIVSANNNITRIKKIIEKLCNGYGENKGDYFAFPSLESLQSATVDELKSIGLGYRAEYIYQSARLYKAVEKELQSDLQNAVAILQKLKGVGEKVANCITLFGLYQTNSYPVDTWIFKANKSETLDTKQKVYDFYTARYGRYSGYAQQYIFYFNRENKN